jgi:tRNA(fMet)-specific endonuclease VapC
MKCYVLDTDILTLLERKDSTVVGNLLARSGADEICTTVVTVEEQLSGWYTFIRGAKTLEKLVVGYRALADTVQGLAQLRILTFSEDALRRRESLKSMKLGVRKMDLGIAAIVLEHGAILVTRNERDFSRIPGLTCEDWSKEASPDKGD